MKFLKSVVNFFNRSDESALVHYFRVEHSNEYHRMIKNNLPVNDCTIKSIIGRNDEFF